MIHRAILLLFSFIYDSHVLRQVSNYTGSGEQFDDWTQACAIYGAATTDAARWDEPIRQFVQANNGDGVRKRPFARETAQWTLNQSSSGEQKMLTIEKVSYLKGTNIFSHVPEAVLASVAQMVKIIELPAHKQFINEGKLAGEMYIIVEGPCMYKRMANLLLN